MLSLAPMAVWDLNLRHLRALVAIADLGSISAAAQAISISQPAITQGLGKLESQLGLPLFERLPGGMAATPATEMFVPRIRAALAHIGSSRVTMAQLRALVAVSTNGNYAAASAATGLAQASLHRALADLSLALRRNLVERRGKGIALTEAGRRTARAFRLARGELEAGLAELAHLLGREISRIAIGAMPLSRARILPAAVAVFHRRHPSVAISIVEGAFHELIEPLRDGALDMIVGALRDPAPGPDIVQHPLFDDRPVVIGRKGHPLDGPGLDALARYPWIMPASGTPLRDQWQRMFSGLSAPPDVPIESGSTMIIRQILVASDFLTLLSPDQVAVELEAGWLARLADTPPGMTRTIGISTRADWRPTAMQAAFMDLLMGEAVRD